MKKVILILSDGMRPDAVMQCGHPMVKTFMEKGACTMTGRTVTPSVTLPCHMSLIHSVDPIRHGVTTNTFMPQVRPIKGLFDQLRLFGKKCGFFYNWGELRDLYQPDSLAEACFISGHQKSWPEVGEMCTDRCIDFIRRESPDFTFLYLGEADESGHKHGWMGDVYMEGVRHGFELTQRIAEAVGPDYVIMLIADHGGHDRTHGTEMPEDMTIPFMTLNGPWEAGSAFETMSIKDVAPTVAKLLEVPANEDWEGTSLI